MNTDLHIYLKKKPPTGEVSQLLKLYGFTFKQEQKVENEPDCTYWTWQVAPLSATGFQLIHFDEPFPDDLYSGKFGSFIVMLGNLDSSEFDLHMIDITAAMLLKLYGGVIHNPHRTDRKYPNVFLCGKNNTKS